MLKRSFEITSRTEGYKSMDEEWQKRYLHDMRERVYVTIRDDADDYWAEIGFYFDAFNKGSFLGEIVEAPYMQIDFFNEGARAMLHCVDVLAQLSLMDRKTPTVDEFASLLERLGFINETYSNGEEDNED